MTFRTSLLVGVLTIVPAFASAQQKPLKMSEPIVHVGLFAIESDERTGGMAAQTVEEPGESDSGLVYMAPCGRLGASDGGRPLPSSTTEAWELSTRALAMTDTDASVQVTWRRIRRGSEDAPSAPQSLMVTLERGKPVVLDQVVVPPNGACEGRAVSLDLLYASRDDRREQAMARRRGNAAAPLTTAAGMGNVATSAIASRGGGRVFFNAAGDEVSARVVAAGMPPPVMQVAELWLVSSRPGQPDESQLQVVVLGSSPRAFTFSPVTIHTSSGTATVTVTGTVETGLTPAGEPRFYLTARRAFGFEPNNRPARDAAPQTDGSSKAEVPMPGPDEVLSFELPALQGAGASLPDRFSIRVRILETPMQEKLRAR